MQRSVFCWSDGRLRFCLINAFVIVLQGPKQLKPALQEQESCIIPFEMSSVESGNQGTENDHRMSSRMGILQ